MGDAAYRDNWADAFGPGTAWAPHKSPPMPGSSVAARIVECTPGRHPGGHKVVSTVGVARHPCEDFAASMPRPGGSLPPPGLPLASLCCRGKTRAGKCAEQT